MNFLRALFAPRKLPVAKLGARGERRAAWFYRMRGYTIVDRNVRLPAGEIDLVVKRGMQVVIAEVKTRQSLIAGEGHEAVHRSKRERLIRLGDQYAARHPEVRLRYDILSLFWTGRRFLVTHYEDAFRPMADPLRPWISRAP
ncbi:MAG: YraN family protein [Thermoanaerobaculia bacterium]